MSRPATPRRVCMLRGDGISVELLEHAGRALAIAMPDARIESVPCEAYWIGIARSFPSVSTPAILDTCAYRKPHRPHQACVSRTCPAYSRDLISTRLGVPVRARIRPGLRKETLSDARQ